VAPTQIYTLILLTAVVAALVGVLVFAGLRFAAAVRDVRSRTASAGSEHAFMAGAMQDAVTRLRDQERMLEARARASERLSSEVVTGIPSGVLLVGRDERVRLANPAARRLLVLDEGAVIDHPLDAVLSGAPGLLAVLREVLRTHEPVARRAVAVPNPAGSGVRHFGVTASPTEGDGVICLFTDLTDVMAREERVRLGESLARLGELTAGLAHEFRNGLATIHGYARLLDPASFPPATAACIEGIRDETAALGQVVTNFLEFARPERLALVPVDVGAVVRHVADEWRPRAEAAGGRLEISGRFAEVAGDELLLRRAVDNLCRNGVEACEAAGRPPVIAISGRIAPGELVVAVEDGGPGIDPAVADRLFQPFVTTRSRGTGLGLAVVQKIVVMHNGRVVAANGPAGGARLEVGLPLLAGPSTVPSGD
jgi:signal transduction histidine kinase